MYSIIIFIFISSLKKHCSPLVSFFEQLIDSSSRVNADVYTYMFLCDFFNIFVVVFGFSAFGVHNFYFKSNQINFKLYTNLFVFILIVPK